MTTLSDAQIAAVAAQAGFSGESLVIAIAIAKAESSGNAEVINFLGCVGLWQIYQSVHAPAHPTWTTPWLQVPANNAVAAYALSSGGNNWVPWETFTNGMYLAYLDEAAVAAGAPDGTGVPTTEPTGVGAPGTATLEFLTGANLVSTAADNVASWINQANPVCVALSPTRFVVGVVNGTNHPELAYDMGSVRYLLLDQNANVLATTVLDWVDQEPNGDHGRDFDGWMSYLRAARVDDTHFLEWAQSDWVSDAADPSSVWVRQVSVEGDAFTIDYGVVNPLPPPVDTATAGLSHDTLNGRSGGRHVFVPSLGLMLVGSTKATGSSAEDRQDGLGMVALDATSGAPAWGFSEPATFRAMTFPDGRNTPNGPDAWSMVLSESEALLLSWAYGDPRYDSDASAYQRRYSLTSTGLTPLGGVEPVPAAESFAYGTYFDSRYIVDAAPSVRIPPAPAVEAAGSPLSPDDVDFLAGGMGVIANAAGDVYAAIVKVNYTPPTVAEPAPVDLGNSTSSLDATPQEPVVNFSPVS